MRSTQSAGNCVCKDRTIALFPTALMTPGQHLHCCRMCRISSQAAATQAAGTHRGAVASTLNVSYVARAAAALWIRRVGLAAGDIALRGRVGSTASFNVDG